MIRNKRKLILTILLITIFSIGAFLRIYNLHVNPPGFFADEAAIGYNAYTMANTLHDEHGNFLPAFFESFGDYKGGLAIYATTPFVYFSTSEFATRLPFAIAGLATIILIFLIGKHYINLKFGILSALIAAITPWLIHYSRIAFELNIYVALFLLVIFLFTKIKQHPLFIVLAFITAALSFYTYRASFIQIPLLILFLCVLYRKHLLKNIKHTVMGAFLMLLIMIPFVMHLVGGDGFARYNQVATLSEDKLSISEKLINLKDTYLYHFSPEFLFINGDNFFVTRHFIEDFPPLLIVFLPFLIIGFLYILKDYKNIFSILCIYWLIIFPISGSLTIEPPYTSRSIIGAPLFVLIVSLGIYKFIDHKIKPIYWNYIKVFIFVVALSLNFFIFLNYYFIKYPKISADFWGWQYGPKEIVSYFNTNENNYDELYMQGQFNAPYIFLEFYAPDSCENCYIGDPTHNYNPDIKQLFAVTPEYIRNNPQYEFTTRHKVIYPNNQVAFEIVEIVE